MLPGWSWLAEQFDTGLAEFFGGGGEVANGEAGHRAGTEVFLARVAEAEDFHVAAIGKLEDPEISFGVHQAEAKHVQVEVRQFRRTPGPGATPAKPCDLHPPSIAADGKPGLGVDRPHISRGAIVAASGGRHPS